MPVAIVTDSSCDLTPAQAAQAGIDLVPIIVHIGAKEYRDGADLTLSEFYAQLRTSTDLPHTTPPPVEAFAAAFQKHAAAGNDVVCVTVASKVSQIYAQATSAAASFGNTVRVIDSRSLSGGLGLLATGAARLARSGADAATIGAAIERWSATQHGYAAYPDLKFLSRSGRINKAQLALGLLMHLFPVTRVATSGEMETETTVKSWDQAKEMLASVASRKIQHPQKTRVAITHTNAPDVGEYVAATLRSKLSAPLKELNVYAAGPTIGANVGPGAAGIFMIEE